MSINLYQINVLIKQVTLAWHIYFILFLLFGGILITTVIDIIKAFMHPI